MVVGKVHFMKLLRDRAQQLGDDFTVKQFMDEFYAAGVIPMSLIRWEMTGHDDEIKELGLKRNVLRVVSNSRNDARECLLEARKEIPRESFSLADDVLEGAGSISFFLSESQYSTIEEKRHLVGLESLEVLQAVRIVEYRGFVEG